MAALGAGAMLSGVARGQGAGDARGPSVDGAGASKHANGQAKNVIFMVSDGMSFGTLTLGDLWIRRTRKEREKIGGAWAEVWNTPGVKRAVQRTSSLDSIVTDSAAAGSAWGCGEHLNNGSINVRPDGSQVLPIMLKAKQHGKMTGVVTTARVTHATPASFYANSPRRDYEGIIAGDFMQRGIDVGLGGGERFFPASLLAKFPDVKVVRNAEELRGAQGSAGRLLGIFAQSHVPFVIDREATVPGLAEMTKAALARLEKGERGFVLQIEAGRVDHAAHNNDAATLVHEQVEFEDTIRAVREWMKDRDDTLLVITTDHANANPGLTLYAEEGNRGFETLGKIRHSFDWIHDETKDIKNVAGRMAAFPKVVKEATGVELSNVEQRMLMDVLNEKPVMPFADSNIWPCVLGAILAQHTGVSFISHNHAADHTEFTAIGPGSERVGGVIENIDAHGMMVEAMGLGPVEMPEGMKEKFKMPKAPKPD
jgi:alkaline phosphatase